MLTFRLTIYASDLCDEVIKDLKKYLSGNGDRAKIFKFTTTKKGG